MIVKDYKCTNCDHVQEVWLKSINSENTETCEKCNSPLELQISSGGFILKGNDWYKSGFSSS